MPDDTTPNEAELLAFLEKLADFHETLTPAEQTMLDELTAAGLGREEAEVSGFMQQGPLVNQQFFQGLSPRPYYTRVGDLLGGMGSG